MAELTVQQEHWETFGPAVPMLFQIHWNEVEVGVEPRRKFAPDYRAMKHLDDLGILKIIAARHYEDLVGYITWQVAPDIESEGLIIAMQGAWYTLPGYPLVAHKLWKKSIEVLREARVSCVFPHYRVQGRGQNLGRFFEAEGAKLIQHSYVLWIGEENA